MDHKDAERIHASSRYLIGDLPAEESAAFEEHYFTCAECAAEVTADEVFAANLRTVLKDQARPRPVVSSVAAAHAKLASFHRFSSAWAMPLAAAACLLLAVLLYQSLFTIPGLRTQMAVLRDPPPPVAVALKLARGESRFTISKGSPFWVPYFRLANPDAQTTYECVIENASGKEVKTVSPLTAQPGQPFYMVLPSSLFPDGSYRFKVRGRNSTRVIAEYTIDVIHE